VCNVGGNFWPAFDGEPGEKVLSTNDYATDHIYNVMETNPKVSGDIVVWESGLVNKRISMYQFSFYAETYFDPSVPDTLHPPKRGGNNYDIMMPGAFLPPVASIDYLDPVVYGTTIAWVRQEMIMPAPPGALIPTYDIMLVRLNESKDADLLFQVGDPARPGDQTQPVIQGNQLMFISGNNVYMYDLSTGRLLSVTSGATIRRDPAVYGNNIIWSASNGVDDDLHFRNTFFALEAGADPDPNFDWNDIQNTLDWQKKDAFSKSEWTENIAGSINDYLREKQASGTTGTIDVPLNFHSGSKGKLDVKGVEVKMEFVTDPLSNDMTGTRYLMVTRS
jgi:hypothetical protein